MPRLLVTGTRQGRLDVRYWLNRWVRKYGPPDLVIVGDSDRWTPWLGVDGQARVWAAQNQFNYWQVRACTAALPPWRYEERDAILIDSVGFDDFCLGFLGPRDRGPGPVLRLCHERGVQCFAPPSVQPDRIPGLPPPPRKRGRRRR